MIKLQWTDRIDFENAAVSFAGDSSIEMQSTIIPCNKIYTHGCKAAFAEYEMTLQ